MKPISQTKLFGLDKYFNERLDQRLKRKTFINGVTDKDFFKSTRELIR